MKRIELLPTLREFLESKGVGACTDPILKFQEPGVNGQSGPRQEGSTGWRLCKNKVEQFSGGGTLFPVDLEDNESRGNVLGQAVTAASEMGAVTIYLDYDPVDEIEEDMMRSMFDKCPQVTAFRKGGGKVMVKQEEWKPQSSDD